MAMMDETVIGTPHKEAGLDLFWQNLNRAARQFMACRAQFFFTFSTSGLKSPKGIMLET